MKSYKLYVPAFTILLLVIIVILKLSSNVEINEPLIEEEEIEETIKIEINLSELNQKEQDVAMEIIDTMDEKYLELQRSIRFTKNLSQYKNLTEPLGGFNRNKGEIYINYSGRINQMKRTLCHELLHTYIFSNNETHEIVRDLAKKKVCYNGGAT